MRKPVVIRSYTKPMPKTQTEWEQYKRRQRQKGKPLLIDLIWKNKGIHKPKNKL